MREMVKAGTQPRGTRLRRPPRRPSTARLKSERVEELLKAMPDWSLSMDGGSIQYTRVLPTARVAGLFAGYVSDFASSCRQGACVMLSGRQVVVSLPGAPQGNGGFGGLTEEVFVLAQQIG